MDKVEDQLGKTPYLAGELYTLADINFFSHLGLYLQRMFPEIGTAKRCPRLLAWVERVKGRPGVQEALAMPDRTNPALRAFTGEVK